MLRTNFSLKCMTATQGWIYIYSFLFSVHLIKCKTKNIKDQICCTHLHSIVSGVKKMKYKVSSRFVINCWSWYFEFILNVRQHDQTVNPSNGVRQHDQTVNPSNDVRQHVQTVNSSNNVRQHVQTVNPSNDVGLTVWTCSLTPFDGLTVWTCCLIPFDGLTVWTCCLTPFDGLKVWTCCLTPTCSVCQPIKWC
jgi:hypothetical protein